MSGERINPNEIVGPLCRVQKNPGVSSMYVMLRGRLIRKILFGHTDDYRIELDHI
jgi:hypothetical protein